MTIGIEAPSVANEEEALTLMLHHLELAAAYFEATPLKFEDRLQAVEHFGKPAIFAFVREMEGMYAGLR